MNTSPFCANCCWFRFRWSLSHLLSFERSCVDMELADARIDATPHAVSPFRGYHARQLATRSGRLIPNQCGHQPRVVTDLFTEFRRKDLADGE